jgi:uncharacterized phage infection (PIP) family protein YhgE
MSEPDHRSGRRIRHDETMPGEDALSEAIDELYSIDPDDFTKRRGELASEARSGGDGEAARAITALRRPTKAAGIVNRLARSQPDVTAGLTELGDKLRKAQRTLDGARLRELTQQRRKLIDAATRQAFELSDLPEPAATLRSEVASTLEAALADPDVAEQLTSGTLVRSAQWSGFGDSTPTLSAVPPLPARSAERSGRGTKTPAKAETEKRATSKRAAVDHAEQRRQERMAAAQEQLDKASGELQAAEEAEREQGENVALLSEQLADARRRLDEARLGTRQAKNRYREAERKLTRVKG